MKKLLKLLTFVVILFTLSFTGLNKVSGQIKKSNKSKIYKKNKSSDKSKSKRKKRVENEAAERYDAPGKENEDEFEEDHKKREEWFMYQRSFPFDSIPVEARRKAFEERPADADFGESQFAAPQWKQIGPQPTNSYFPNNWGLTSGRINSVAVSPANPNIIIIGAASGGVWRSTDGGANFTSVTDAQVDIAVGSISFSASNPNIVYAGMGDKDSNYFGSGVLRSNDAGLTWTRVSNNSLPAPGRISQILVDPNNSNRVYAAQYSNLSGATLFASGFFVSADGGVSWTKTFNGLPKDLVQHPTQPNTLYMSSTREDGGSSSLGGVYKSINNGQTWTRIYSSPFSSTSNAKIAVTPSAPSNIYVLIGSGSTARVEISTDEGANWTNKGSNFDTAQFSYNCYIFVHPAQPNTLYVGTRDLWRSTDGGTNYTNITNNFTLSGGYTPTSAKAHPDQHHFYISNSDPNTIYIAGDGGLWKSTNSASTFQSLNATLGLTMFVSLDLHPTDATRSYGGTQDNGTQKRTGNQSWREFATGDGGQTIIDPLDPTIVYTTYVYNTVYRYNNNGDSYSGRIGDDSVFNTDRVAFYPPFEANEANGNLFFGTYRLYKSTNRGASWAQLAGGLDLTYGSDVLSAIGTSKANPNYIYTGSSNGRVMVSTDGGATFTDRTAGLPQRFIKSITISPTNPATAFLTVSGYLTSHVFKTVNGGANWTDISGNLPDIPVNTLLIDPTNSNTLYIGTDIGVFRSTAGGSNWQTFNMNFPPTIVSELDAQASGLLQAATYGRGMFEININPGSRAVADFDGDGKTDISVFRPSTGNWFITNSSNNGFNAATFGQNGDIITPGDYDNDGKADYAVFRNGNWYILRSSDNIFFGIIFGVGTDKPIPADYDGDGKTDIAVFRNGAWYVLKSSDNQIKAGTWGFGTDITVPGDYDGDGKADFAVFRPSDGNWYILKSSDNGLIAYTFGQNGDKPVPADYDADGKTDFAVFRGGIWYVQQTTAGFRGLIFGAATDIPAQGDYDGDGKTDFGVFRPSNGTWYISLNANNAFVASAFGAGSDVPVPSAYNH